ncbi:hypothetical protein BJ994_000490 [Arthrobacter pigmenti]|uniref:Uncharacterized protein n=1 Tax=Arthrobacter pigmenti TaxID=271432 RepID=A0A846RM81_9MICC|nr:hypothetical protein [Arthrobacter pigmenti]
MITSRLSSCGRLGAKRITGPGWSHDQANELARIVPRGLKPQLNAGVPRSQFGWWRTSSRRALLTGRTSSEPPSIPQLIITME